MSQAIALWRSLERFNPLQKRDRDGRWTDGMPHVIAELPLQTTAGALHVRATRHGQGGAGHRDVELDDGGHAVVLTRGEQRQLAGALGNQYQQGDFTLTRDGRTIARVRPAGRASTDDGETVSTRKHLHLGEVDDPAEYDSRPGVLLSSRQADSPFDVALGAAAGASRHETGYGPLDAFPNGKRQMTLRMRDEHGKPTEVTFSAVEWNRIRDAYHLVWEGFDDAHPDAPDVNTVRVKTKAGPVDVEWAGPRDALSADSRLQMLPAYPAAWSVVIDGEHLAGVLDSWNWAGVNAGVHESRDGTVPAVSVAVELWRALEAWDPGKHPRIPKGQPGGGKFLSGGGGKKSLADVVKDTAKQGPKRQRTDKGGMSLAAAVRTAARTSDATGRPTRRTDAEHRAHGAHDVADEVERALVEAGAPDWVRTVVQQRARGRAETHGPRPDSLPSAPKVKPKDESTPVPALSKPAPPAGPVKAAAKPRRTGVALPADRVSDVAAQLKAARSRDEAHAALDGLTVPQLRQIAEHHDIKPGSKATKAKVADAIVDNTAGRRLDSAAISHQVSVKPAAPKAEVAATAAPSGDFSAHAAGTDLVGSDPTALARAVVADRGSHRAADQSLAAIGQRQGFDGKPRVVSKAEMDRLVADGHPEVFRGVVDSPDGSVTAKKSQEEMRSGHAYYGTGIYGNGYYWGHREVADSYAKPKNPSLKGEVARGVLAKDAKVVDFWKDLQPEWNSFMEGLAGRPDEAELREVYGDPGRYAAARGYDAILIAPDSLNDTLGKPREGEKGWYNVLNRTSMVVEEAS
jgi:hypothetical protein